MCTTPPPRIDLIESLGAIGEMPLAAAVDQAGGPRIAWFVLPLMVREQTAAIWIIERNGERRRLADWEVAQLARARTGVSNEPVPRDKRFVVCAAEKTSEAFDRDWGRWYHEHLGREKP